MIIRSGGVGVIGGFGISGWNLEIRVWLSGKSKLVVEGGVDLGRSEGGEGEGVGLGFGLGLGSVERN